MAEEKKTEAFSDSYGHFEKKKGILKWIKDQGKINKAMVPVKIAVFCYIGGVTAFLPYLTLHMQEIGLTMEEIAIIYAVLPVSSVIGPVIAGVMADKTGRYTLVLCLNIIFCGLFHSLLLTVPSNKPNELKYSCNSQNYSLAWRQCEDSFDSPTSVYSLTFTDCRYTCNNPKDEIKLCFVDFEANSTDCIYENIENQVAINASVTRPDNGTCNLIWKMIQIQNKIYDGMTCDSDCPLKCRVQGLPYSENKEQESQAGQSKKRWSFWIYFIYRVLGGMNLSACFNMLDVVMLAKVKECKGDFGKQRTVAMISQALLPLLAGIFVDISNNSEDDVNYQCAFYLGDFMLLLTTVVLLKMNLKVASTKESVTKNILKLFSRVEIVIFLIILTLLGSKWGFLETYLFLYLKELNAPTYMFGLTLTVGCAAGLPAMFFSDLIVKKLGRCTVFVASFIAYCIRFLGYSYIWSPWLCFPFELLEVVTYQIMWVAAATYCPVLAPKGLLATTTNLAGAAHYSVGRGLGSFIGGYLITWYGLRLTFRAMAYTSLAGAILYLISHKLIIQKKIAVREKLQKTAEILCKDTVPADVEEALQIMKCNSRRSSFA